MKYQTRTITVFDQSYEFVIRDDGAQIPVDPSNTDYQGFLAWLAEGNEPDPYIPESEPPLA